MSNYLQAYAAMTKPEILTIPRRISVIGGPPSKSVMAAYRQRQAAQLTVAVADYHQAFTAILPNGKSSAH